MAKKNSAIALKDKCEARIEREPNSGCWLWSGIVAKNGYGILSYWVGGKVTGLAHRIVYELHRGPIEKGLELDHKCRVRSCVNPDHLEPVTHAENCLRSPLIGGGRPRPYRVKSHCKWGHAMVEENVGIARRRGTRYCKTCVRTAAYKQGRQQLPNNVGVVHG